MAIGGIGMTGMGMERGPVAGQVPLPTGMPPIPGHLTGSSPAQGGTPPAPTPQPPITTPQTAQNALGNFANSTGMQFAMSQGSNALNNLYAARGQVQSGAAAKALQSFGQNTALQDYFMPYMSLLGQQQATGAGAASSIAGVGSNFGNAVTGINAGMANALGMGAMNIGAANANRAIIGGLANANLGSTIGSALGQVGSSFFGNTGGMPSYNGSAPWDVTLPQATPYTSLPGGLG